MSRETILLCGDLIFTSKIKGTADHLGVPCRVVGTVAAAREAVRETTRHLIIDLSIPIASEEMAELRSSLPAEATMTAFGSHVDTDRLAAAKDAGCDSVLPRSQFTARLVEILQGGE